MHETYFQLIPFIMVLEKVFPQIKANPGIKKKHHTMKFSISLSFYFSQKQSPEVFCKKVSIKISQYSQENTCARVSFLLKLQASDCKFTKKETLAQVFSCEFCKISKNTFFTEHLRAAASV